MNFTEIILNGFFDDRNRKYLDKYFYREFERLKPQLYENKEYFEECLSVIQNIEKHFLENEEFENNKTDLVGLLWLDSEENSISEIEVYHKDKIEKIISNKRVQDALRSFQYDIRICFGSYHKITYSEIEELTKAIHTAYKKCLNEEPKTKELENKSISFPQQSTQQIIEEHFNLMDRKLKYKYAFRHDNDYKDFVLILVDYFEQNEYSLQNIPTIQLKNKCKTKLAKTIKNIYNDLSEIPLSSNTEFMNIIRKLSVFKDDTNLYKSIAR